ncbi:MAG: hypothetical protein HON43_03000 [Alphaproteobacteria bacterium]|nr:hypothetical protein [Alphaproteobacteria bacterium]MBT5390029.1 hypothetical protein [Alphaproteobacteria bacterium]
MKSIFLSYKKFATIFCIACFVSAPSLVWAVEGDEDTSPGSPIISIKRFTSKKISIYPTTDEPVNEDQWNTTRERGVSTSSLGEVSFKTDSHGHPLPPSSTSSIEDRKWNANQFFLNGVKALNAGNNLEAVEWFTQATNENHTRAPLFLEGMYVTCKTKLENPASRAVTPSLAKNMPTIVFVGSGYSSLPAAILCRSFGLNVIIVEKNERLFSGASILAIRLHSGGEYSTHEHTSESCMYSSLLFLQMLPEYIFANLPRLAFLVSKLKQEKLESEEELTLEQVRENYERRQEQYSELFAELRKHFDSDEETGNQFLGLPSALFEELEEDERFPQFLGGILTKEKGMNPMLVGSYLLNLLKRKNIETYTNHEVTGIIKYATYPDGETPTGYMVLAGEPTKRIHADFVVIAGSEGSYPLINKLINSTGSPTDSSIFVKHSDEEMLTIAQNLRNKLNEAADESALKESLSNVSSFVVPPPPPKEEEKVKSNSASPTDANAIPQHVTRDNTPSTSRGSSFSIAPDSPYSYKDLSRFVKHPELHIYVRGIVLAKINQNQIPIFKGHRSGLFGQPERGGAMLCPVNEKFAAIYSPTDEGCRLDSDTVSCFRSNLLGNIAALMTPSKDELDTRSQKTVDHVQGLYPGIEIEVPEMRVRCTLSTELSLRKRSPIALISAFKEANDVFFAAALKGTYAASLGILILEKLLTRFATEPGIQTLDPVLKDYILGFPGALAPVKSSTSNSRATPTDQDLDLVQVVHEAQELEQLREMASKPQTKRKYPKLDGKNHIYLPKELRLTDDSTPQDKLLALARKFAFENGFPVEFADPSYEIDGDFSVQLERVLSSKFITELNLSGRQLSDTEAETLGQQLRKHSHLTHLSISRCGISDDRIETILYDANNLISLDASDNVFGEAGIKSIARLLVLGDGNLTKLYLASSRLNQPAIEKLSPAVKRSKLSLLDLSSNSVNGQLLTTLVDSLENHETVSILNLKDNRIDVRDCSCLARLFRKNSVLKDVDLSHNSINNQGWFTMLTLGLVDVSAFKDENEEGKKEEGKNESRTDEEGPSTKLNTNGIVFNRSLQHLNLDFNSGLDDHTVRVIKYVLRQGHFGY